jgi:hypothetical protein
MNLEKIRSLDGKIVLVKPAIPDDPNSVGLRGTLKVIEVAEPPGMPPRVEIVLSYPERSDMNGRAAHEEIVPLSQTDIARLLASERNGADAYEYTLAHGGKTVR